MRFANRLLFRASVPVVLALSASFAYAGDILPSDFLSPVITTFDGLSLSSPQSLPYTDTNGNVYSSASQNTFFYGDFGSTGDCYANECIGSSAALADMTITLADPSARAGFYLGVADAQVTFYDTSDDVLDQEDVDPPVADGSNVWIGWEDDGSDLIGSIEIVGLDPNYIFTVDNVTYDADNTVVTPEPATLLMIGPALVAIAAFRRRRG